MRQALWLLGVLVALVILDVALRSFLSPYQLQVVVLCGINIVLAVSLAYYFIWLLYLMRSKRVRNTFG